MELIAQMHTDVGHSAHTGGIMARAILLSALLIFACGCSGDPSTGRRAGPDAAFASRHAADTARTVTRRVLAHDVIDFSSDPSPDGRQLVHTDWITGELSMMDLGTQEVRQLTSYNEAPYSVGFGMMPKFSPDGRDVVFAWWADAKPWEWGLRVVAAAGGEARALYENESTVWIEPTDWSPDGTSVLAVRGLIDGTNELVLVARDEGSVRILKSFDWRSPNVARFSPDGRHIVYDFPPEEGSTVRDLYLLSLAERREIRLLEHPADDRLLDWTPDGRHILFSSDRDGTPGAWLLPVENGRASGAPVLVKADFWQVSPIGFTRDGRFFYGVQVGDQNVYTTMLDLTLGRVISSPQPVAPVAAGRRESPAWSPDGRSVAYRIFPSPRANGRFRLGFRSMETGETREVPLPPDLYPRGLRWAPDGQTIFLNGTARGRSALYRLDVQTTRIERLHHLPADRAINQFDLAPDARSLVWWGGHRGDDGAVGVELVRLDVQTRREHVLFRSGHQMRNPAISPDRRSIVFTHDGVGADGAAQLVVLPLAGGEPRVVLDGVNARASADWAPDGQSLVVADHAAADGDDDGVFSLVHVPLDGGTPSPLGGEMKFMQRIQLSPDGRQVAFQAGRQRTEIWVMEQFLPGANRSATTGDADGPIARRLLVEPGVDGTSSISRTADRIAFTDWETGDLTLLDPSTNALHRLTRSDVPFEGGFAMFPEIDAAGEEIAYTWTSTRATELRLISTGGGEPRVLYTGEELDWVQAEDWSPDGQWILAIDSRRGDGANRILLVSRDGEVRVLKAIDWRGTSRMRFSPDGRHIAFDVTQHDTTSRRDIHVLDLRTRRAGALVTHAADDALLGWSPDGRHLLFSSDRSGVPGAWKLPVRDGEASGEPVLVKPDFWRADPIGVSTDGRLFYSVATGSRNAYVARFDPVSGRATGAPVPLSHSPPNGAVYGPAWSRDGARVSYRLLRPPFGRIGRNSIMIVPTVGGDEREILLDAGTYPLAVRWSADGHSLLLSGLDRRGHRTLHRVDPQTGRLERIQRSATREFPYEFQLMSDGHRFIQRIYSDEAGGPPWQVREHDLRTDHSRVIHASARRIAYTAAAPSGSSLAVLQTLDGSTDLELMLFPLAGGEPNVLAQLPAGATIAMSPDGRWIYFTRPASRSTSDPAEVWRVSVSGGEPAPLGIALDGISHLAVGPDGATLALTGGSSSTELWVLENLLR